MAQTNGLLIDYYYCSGCRTCEVACKNEQGLSPESLERGIKVLELGPWELADGRWEWNYFPIPTKLCDLCASRVEAGDIPTCVLHCQAKVITYGTVEELSKQLTQVDGKHYLFLL